MKKFTITDIRKWKPCYDPSRYLAESWQGTALDILNDKRIPFEDRLWVIMRTDLVSERLMRRFGVWCARQVQHLMNDERSIQALDVMEAYAENRWLIDDPDYAAAWEDERITARSKAVNADDTAGVAAWATTWEVAEDAAFSAARDAVTAATDAARCAAWYATQFKEDKAVRAAAARSAASAASAARDAALVKQEQKLREMLIAGIETGDTK
jgi:hypothetical protein